MNVSTSYLLRYFPSRLLTGLWFLFSCSGFAQSGDGANKPGTVSGVIQSETGTPLTGINVGTGRYCAG